MGQTYHRKLAISWRVALLILVLCGMAAGCGSAGGGQADATSTSPTDSVAPPTATTQPQPTIPPPTPFPTGTFVTYSNTAYHYSIPYPSNWMVDSTTTATSQVYDVYNYNYHLQQFQTPYLSLPLFKVEVAALSNPSHLAPLDFFKQQISQPGQAGGTPAIASSQAARVAGRDAVEVVTTQSSFSATITYLVPNGDTLFEVSQFNSDGQPAPVFAQMVAGFVITG